MCPDQVKKESQAKLYSWTMVWLCNSACLIFKLLITNVFQTSNINQYSASSNIKTTTIKSHS